MQTSNHALKIKGISSMATKHILHALGEAYQAKSGVLMDTLSIGGVDAAKRVAAGEAFDIAFLASDAIDKLIAAGHIHQDSRVDWVKSTVAVAVRTGTATPDISSEASVRAAVVAAPSISYSTGPSGVYLTQLFERWGLTDMVKEKLVQAPPGVPVGSLVANGEVSLGFQQLSELQGVAGINVLGNLPEAIAYITTFSSGIPTLCSPAQTQAAQDLQAFLASAELETIKREQGMYWSSPTP
jgi:molybdate transport system substrate-binding protein